MSPEATSLLRELTDRPEWREILEDIKSERIPRYKPIKEADHQQEAQFYNWVFYSGRALENARIIEKLTGVKS